MPTASLHVRPFRDCRDGPRMMVIPAGRFVIGSPADEGGRDRPRALQEGPQRAVVDAFVLGTGPVTRGE